MIRTTQRRTLRLIIQTEKIQNKRKKRLGRKKILKMMKAVSLTVNRKKKTVHTMDVTKTTILQTATIQKALQAKNKRKKIGLSTLKIPQEKVMRKCRHTT